MRFSRPSVYPDRQRGHTFVELLLTIAVIGALSSVAIIAYNGHLREAVLETQNRRNAQEIAAECQRAAAAGVDVFQDGGLEDAILNLIDGIVAADGPFRGRAFKVVLPTRDDYHGAMFFLEKRAEEVLYLPERDSP